MVVVVVVVVVVVGGGVCAKEAMNLGSPPALGMDSRATQDGVGRVKDEGWRKQWKGDEGRSSVSMYVCTNIRVCVCVCVCLYINGHACVCVCVCVCVCAVCTQE